VFPLRPIVIFTAILVIAVTLSCGGGGSGTGTSGPGGTWEQLNLPFGVTQVNFVAFNSSDHWFIADRSQGFYRSADQGATWTAINSGLATTLGWTINVDPANNDLIASTFSGSALNANPVVFYRSSDEGNNWSAIPSGHLSASPALTGCIFAANANMVCGGYWSPYPSSGAWVSSNSGQTTVSATTSSPNGGSVFSLGLDPLTQDLWFGTEQEGVFRSTDNGLTWTKASPPDLQIDPVNGIRDGNIFAITFDRNGNVLFGAQGGIWKSSKTGTGYSWTNVFTNSNTSAGRALARDANGNLYYGHDHDTLDPIAVYRSTDDGTNWAAFNSGIPAFFQGSQFAIDSKDGRLYAVIANDSAKTSWLYRTVNPVQ
jgi:hypothetical protein